MTSKVNQLIIKGLRTQSDAEAESCFRMARKYFNDNGGKIKSQPSASSSDAEAWKKMYADQRTRYLELVYRRNQEAIKHERELNDVTRSLESKINFWKSIAFVSFVMTLFIIALLSG